MKKIFIKHLPNTLNYGSMMMGENLIYYLNKELKGEKVEFYTDTKYEFHLKRLKKATGVNKIYMDEKYKYKEYFSKVKYVRVFERRIKEFISHKKADGFYDAVIFLGGDDFSEIYYKVPEHNKIIKNVLNKLDKFNKNNNLFMIGQTIGPYTGERKTWASDVFSKIRIYTRDDESAKYLKEELKVDVKKSRDLAFLDLKLQKDYKKKTIEILKSYGLKKEKYITVVGSGLNKLYTKNENDFLESFLKIIKNLETRYPDYKIVWLSHVVTRNGVANDNVLLDKLNAKYKNYITKNLVVVRKEILPMEARILLGNGYFTITCRMHAAVSTFQMGKPAICLSYSPKYKGVIGKGLDMENLVIETADEKIWKGQILKTVEEKIDYIENNYSELKKTIKTRVSECKKIVSKTIKEISKEIK